MANERIQVQAKSVELAVEKALTLLGTTRDNMAFEVTKTNNGKLLSFLTGSRIEISAWCKREGATREPAETRRGASRGGSANQRANRDAMEELERRTLTSDEIDALIDELRTFCADLCRFMVGHDVAIHAEHNDGRLILDADDDAVLEQMNRSSKLAEAMEHLLRKKPRHLRQELPFRVFFDVRGMRRSRETELIGMARDLSEKVITSRRPIVLNYRSSYDRKIIHMALDGDDRVYTKSIGSGSNRRLMIVPSRDEGVDLENAEEVFAQQ